MYSSYPSRTRMPRCTKTDLPSLTLNRSVYMYIKNILLKRVITSWCGTFPSSAANVTLRQKRKYLWFYTPIDELDSQRCEFEKKTFLIFKCIRIQKRTWERREKLIVLRKVTRQTLRSLGELSQMHIESQYLLNPFPISVI